MSVRLAMSDELPQDGVDRGVKYDSERGLSVVVDSFSRLSFDNPTPAPPSSNSSSVRGLSMSDRGVT